MSECCHASIQSGALYLRKMPVRILTLFGEELIPEQMNVAPKVKEKALPQDPFLTGWRPEKHYYTIGEVAKLFNVRTSHIRFWTSEFEMNVRTTRKGDRLYKSENINQIRTIYQLLYERGFTIAGAKAMLKENSAQMLESSELKKALLQLRNQLLHIRNELLK